MSVDHRVFIAGMSSRFVFFCFFFFLMLRRPPRSTLERSSAASDVYKRQAVNAQRSQLLTVMADAVSECRTAADQAAELNETGQVGLIRLAEIWSAIRAKEGMGGLVLEGTEAKILSDVVAQFYAYLSGCMFNDPVGMAIYAELHYMMSSLMLGEWFE